MNISLAHRSPGARASKSITGFNHHPTFRGRFIKTIRPIPPYHDTLSTLPSGTAREHGLPRLRFPLPLRQPPSLPSSTSSRRLGLLSRWNSRLKENETVARNNGRVVKGLRSRGKRLVGRNSCQRHSIIFVNFGIGAVYFSYFTFVTY